MSDPNWDAGIEITVMAKPDHGYWTKALDYIDASKRLMFVVEDERNAPQGQQAPAAGQAGGGAAAQAQKEPNKWSYASDKTCAADGDPKAPLNPANCLLSDAPPGSLIAKIGGSIAGKSDGVKSFIVGSFCVFDLDDKTKGPLYLTMNTDFMSSAERKGILVVRIFRSA